MCLKSVSVLIAVCAAQSFGAVVLDTFDADPMSIAFGERSMATSMFSDPYSQGGSFTLETLFGSDSDMGGIFFNSGVGVRQRASISYNNSGAGLNLDAVDMSIEKFELDFLETDHAFTVNIVLTTFADGDSAGGDARWAVYVPEGVNQTATWSFADFLIINGDFDARDIDDITINFNVSELPTAALDFVATEFRAVVPAPGTLALAGIGGLIGLRRRR